MAENLKALAAGLHPLERKALPHLKSEGTLTKLAAASGLQEVEAMRALQWLEGKECLKIKTEETETYRIKEKGQMAARQGKKTPYDFVAEELKKRGFLKISEIPTLIPSYDPGATGSVIGQLKKNATFDPHAPEGPTIRYYEGMNLQIGTAALALECAEKNDWIIADDKIRDPEILSSATYLASLQGYAEKESKKEKMYSLTPLGIALTKEKEALKSYEERLTPALLKSGAWKEKEFRPYNVTINVPAKMGGRKHFVNDAIDYIKRIWVDLGFEEMEGDHVQTAFWDLDSLFVPQDHPAREMQDTFYLKDPARGALPEELLERIRAVHENGGDTGSLGWRYKFSNEEAARNLLRTHTTVLSAHMLYKIKNGEKKMPGKYFSVSTIYRNEALDWKHLFELHQVEGIVVAEGMTLGHLKGYLRLFFTKMGFTDVRIRPAHFPYTEPSAEVEVFDPEKQQWLELGGAGIFRPEVTKTLIGIEVPVLAWGIGMERSIMKQYGFSDIRALYDNDIDLLKNVKVWMK